MSNRLQELGNQLLLAEEAIAEAEDRLAKAKEVYEELSTETIPEALENADLREFTLTNGHKFSLVDQIFMSPKNANKVEAMKWLQEHGYGDIIKTEIKAMFNVDEGDKARDLLSELVASDIEAVYKSSVHPQTARAWAKEQLEEGVDLPVELLGIHRVVKTRIKKPRS